MPVSPKPSRNVEWDDDPFEPAEDEIARSASRLRQAEPVSSGTFPASRADETALELVLGPFTRRVSVRVGERQQRWVSIDPISAFVLSRIEGSCTIDELIDTSGLSRRDTLVVIATLLKRGVIDLDSES